MNYSKSKFWFSLIGAILLIAVIIGGGYMAYRAGFNQGAISEIAGDVEWTFEDAPFFHPYKHMGRGYLLRDPVLLPGDRSDQASVLPHSLGHVRQTALSPRHEEVWSSRQ